MTAFDDAMDGIPESLPVAAVDLDALAKLREAATPGPWAVQDCSDETFNSDDHRGWWWVWREAALPYYGGVMEMESHPPNCVIGSCEITDTREGDRERADAALIVAAVNALPQLTAALRDVLAYCDQIDRSTFMPGLADTDTIRARIEAALGGEQ